MRLLVSITPHGFGHVAQVAPVVNQLYRQYEGLELVVASSLPESFLRERIQVPFDLLDEAADFGLLMNSALDIDLQASAQAYAELHRCWDARVSEHAARLEALAPDLVLADVPYLSLAAAARAGIPGVALCSLNWADIYRHYFLGRPEASRVLDQMEAAYNSASAFLCPEPAMPMPCLTNRIDIGAIGMRGRNRRNELAERLGLAAEQKIVLVTSGGVETRFPMEQWPVSQGVSWLVRDSWQVQHPDAYRQEACDLPFIDLVASCDAVLGKCGYGTVIECVINRTPLLYIPRPDWPEDESLVPWLKQHRAAYRVAPDLLLNGAFADLVEQAAAMPVIRCDPVGADDAVRYLAAMLRDLEASVGVHREG